MVEQSDRLLTIENLGLTPGTKITNTKLGMVGTFIGLEVREGTIYVQVKFPDYESAFPLTLLGNKFQEGILGLL